MREQNKSLPAAGDDFLRLDFWEPSPVFFKYTITALLASAVAFVIVIRIFAPEQTIRYVGPALAALVGATGWFLLGRGRMHAAINVLSFGSWILITGICVFNGGVRTPVIFAYPALIFLIGWMVSPKAAQLTGYLTVANIAGFVVAESVGVLPTQLPTPPIMYAVVQILIVALATLLIVFLVRSYQARLEERRSVGMDLARHSQDLEASKAELDHAQAVAKIGSWVYEIGSATLRLSDEACRIFAVPAGVQGSYEAYLEWVHPEDRDFVAQVWREVLKGMPFDGEHRIMIGGEVRWVRQKGKLEFSADGLPDRVVGITQDITERKESEHALARQRAELHDLYRSLQTLREDERTKFARELHDDTGHLLTAMLMDLGWIDAKWPKDGSPISSKLASAVTLGAQVVDSIRGIMEDLRPPILDELGLVAAIESFVANFATRAGIRGDLVTSGELTELGDRLATDIFRIVQEALNNVVKHAKATHASVSLTRTEGAIVLVIQDDGTGMGHIGKNGRGHFGIQGIRERVSMLDGTFAVTSEPGRGVRLEAVIPTGPATSVG